MMSVHDQIRNHVLDACGYIEPISVGRLDVLRKSEWSPEFERLLRARLGKYYSEKFEQLMRGALLMGALRYGKLNAPGKQQWDRLSAIEYRWEEYLKTCNKMFLVDIANFCLLEFEEGEGGLLPIPSPFHSNLRLHTACYRRYKNKWELLLITEACIELFVNDIGHFTPTENTKKVGLQ